MEAQKVTCCSQGHTGRFKVGGMTAKLWYLRHLANLSCSQRGGLSVREPAHGHRGPDDGSEPGLHTVKVLVPELWPQRTSALMMTVWASVVCICELFPTTPQPGHSSSPSGLGRSTANPFPGVSSDHRPDQPRPDSKRISGKAGHTEQSPHTALWDTLAFPKRIWHLLHQARL